MLILGIDTGFAALGWAQIEVSSISTTKGLSVFEVVGAGVLTTTKEAKKRQLHIGSDDARRLEQLGAELLELIASETREPHLIAYELPAAAKGARAAHALGLAHGLIRGLHVAHSTVPMVEVTARDVKSALVGRTSATKDHMIEAASRLRVEILDLPKTVQEHAADAVGVAIAAMYTQVAIALRSKAA